MPPTHRMQTHQKKRYFFWPPCWGFFFFFFRPALSLRCCSGAGVRLGFYLGCQILLAPPFWGWRLGSGAALCCWVGLTLYNSHIGGTGLSRGVFVRPGLRWTLLLDLPLACRPSRGAGWLHPVGRGGPQVLAAVLAARWVLCLLPPPASRCWPSFGPFSVCPGCRPPACGLGATGPLFSGHFLWAVFCWLSFAAGNSPGCSSACGDPGLLKLVLAGCLLGTSPSWPSVVGTPVGRKCMLKEKQKRPLAALTVVLA